MWMLPEQDLLCTSPNEESGSLANNAPLTESDSGFGEKVVRGHWRFLRKDRTSLDKAPCKAVGESSVVMARRLRKQPV